MFIACRCPRCEQPLYLEVAPQARALDCPHCALRVEFPELDESPAGAAGGRHLNRCLICPCTDLFVRKDFPQRLGVAIVVAGFAASSVAWYFRQIYLTFGILFATALIDLLLYLWCGEVLMCYSCGAIYRGASNLDAHGAFDLAVHERYRQQAARRLQLAASAKSSPSQQATD